MDPQAVAKARFVTRAIWAPEATSRSEVTWQRVGTKKVEKVGVFGGTKLVDKPVWDMKEVDTPIRAGTTCVDLTSLAIAVDIACAELDADGYDIVSINPINSGRYRHREKRDEQWGKPLAWAFGYGYSLTDGILITGKLRQPKI